MRALLVLALSATALGGCCSKLECEDEPVLAFEDRYFDLLCETYTSCFDDIECSELNAADGLILEGCEFDIDKAQACLDGEYSCDTTVDYEMINIPEECSEAFRCIDG